MFGLGTRDNSSITFWQVPLPLPLAHIWQLAAPILSIGCQWVPIPAASEMTPLHHLGFHMDHRCMSSAEPRPLALTLAERETVKENF